jgi:hypothetical protein
MFKIIKETKFLWMSLSMFFAVIFTFAIMAFAMESCYDNPQTYRLFGFFSLGVSIGLVAMYWVCILLYQRITDFILEKGKYKLPEVRNVMNKLIGLFYFLLVIDVALYFYFVKEPLYYSLVELVMIFSLFVGFITLCLMFSKAKHQLPYRKEQMINSIALILFLASIYFIRILNIDILMIRIPFFGIFASILMTIVLYKRVYDGKFFE